MQAKKIKGRLKFMIEIRCVVQEGKKERTYRRYIRVSDIIEVFDYDGKAGIRVARSDDKRNHWIYTDESFDEIKAKIGMKEEISLENIEVTRLDKLSDEVRLHLLKLCEISSSPYVVKDSILIEYRKH